MAAGKKTFRHESMQTSKDIAELVQAVADGLRKGSLKLESNQQELKMHPNDLLHLKLKASEEDGRSKISLTVVWDNHPPSCADIPSVKSGD